MPTHSLHGNWSSTGIVYDGSVNKLVQQLAEILSRYFKQAVNLSYICPSITPTRTCGPDWRVAGQIKSFFLNTRSIEIDARQVCPTEFVTL